MMSLENRLRLVETRLHPARWVFTTIHFDGCEEEQDAMNRIRARWPVGAHDLILILSREAVGGCPLQGQPHRHDDAEVQRMPHH